MTEDGKILGFGKNSFNKINGSKKESLYFEPIETEEKSTIVNCGANHSVLIDTKGIPYTWGNTLNGRCGLRMENDD